MTQQPTPGVDIDAAHSRRKAQPGEKMIKRKYATTTEAEIRRAVELGMTWRQAAAYLNVSPHQLQDAASILGIRSRTAKPAQPCRSAASGRLYFADFSRGRTIAEIAAKNSISHVDVRDALKAAKLPSTTAQLVAYLLKRELPTAIKQLQAA